MAFIRNTIKQQDKHMRDTIQSDEWNSIVNQLAIQGNYNSLAVENVLKNFFEFKWIPFEEEEIGFIPQIINIPKDSLGDGITTPEELAEFLNSEESQYPAKNTIYQVVNYPRGSRILQVVSTGYRVDLSEELIFSSIEKYLDEINLVDSIETLQEDVSKMDVMWGVVKAHTQTTPLSGLRIIDGYQLKENDLVLVTGLGQTNNGVFIAQADNWLLQEKLNIHSIVSVTHGDIYGGCLLKKMEDETTKVVKEPERNLWIIQE